MNGELQVSNPVSSPVRVALETGSCIVGTAYLAIASFSYDLPMRFVARTQSVARIAGDLGFLGERKR
jgi:hypothetical protein